MIRGNQEAHDELRRTAAFIDGLVLKIVELHMPIISTYRGRETATCGGCHGTIQGQDCYWPEDCSTTQLLARELSVRLELEWTR